MLWMLDNQGRRRNLADIDRISIARKKEVILAEQAKENQRHSDGRGVKGPPISANLIEPIRTREEAAKEAGAGKPKSANPVEPIITRTGFCFVGFNRKKQNRPPPFDRGRSNGRQHNTK